MSLSSLQYKFIHYFILLKQVTYIDIIKVRVYVCLHIFITKKVRKREILNNPTGLARLIGTQLSPFDKWISNGYAKTPSKNRFHSKRPHTIKT